MTTGGEVQVFQPLFFQAAVDARCAVYPVTIRYETLTRTVNILGRTRLLAGVRRVLKEPVVAVEIHFDAPLPARHRSRRELAALAQLAIATRLLSAAGDPLHAALRLRPLFVDKKAPRGSAFPPAGAPARA